MEIRYTPDIFRTAVKIAVQSVLKNQASPTDGLLEFLVDGQGRVALASARSSIAFLSKPENFLWDIATQMCIPVTDIVETISEKALKYNAEVVAEIVDEEHVRLSMYTTTTGLLEAKMQVKDVSFNTIYMFKGMVQGKVRDELCTNPYLSTKMLKLLSSIPRRRDAPKDKESLHFANVPGHRDMFIVTPDWMNGLLFVAGIATQDWNSKEPPMLVGKPI